MATKRSWTRLTFVAVLKLFLSLIIISLGITWEYYQRQQGVYSYVVIGVQILAGAFALCSALADIYALYARSQTLLNLKVAVGMFLRLKIFNVPKISILEIFSNGHCIYGVLFEQHSVCIGSVL